MRNPFKLDDEGRRSVARRGLIGHYIAGAYRVAARPTASRLLVARAKLLAFLWGMDEVANLVERVPERYLNPVLRAFGATIAEEAVLGDGLRLATIHKAGFAPLTVGHKAFLGRRVLIDLSTEVTFGDYCTLGNDTSFVSHTDFAFSPLKATLFPVQVGPVRIGRGAFIGSNTMVTSGVTIGQCSVIGANSLVIHDIPPYVFAAGTPAKVLRELDRSQIPPFDEDEAFIIPEGTI